MSDVVSSSRTSLVHGKGNDVFLLLLLLVSLSLNVYLGWKVQRGRTTSSIQQNLVKLSAGTKVDPVATVGLDGKEYTISYEVTDKPTVFYVLTPTCIWCERNKENLNKLAEVKGNDFRFIGLSLAEAGLKEYVEKHHISFPVYTRLTAEAIKSLGLGGTPQTIVIWREG